MGELPESRVQLSFPLFQSGDDFCGPVYLKFGNSRSKIKMKVYKAVFVCITTKAIHFELV
jgi:hypothetical protein